MSSIQPSDRVSTIVIGGGQAGLAVGYHLARRGVPFTILEAGARVGDVWRRRWDSLRLFTAARFDGLDGMPFPASSRAFPTKDEMADFLETYAAHFHLPVRTSTRVDRVWREAGHFVVSAGGQRFEADNVVVAMATFQQPRVPAFARDLKPRIVQLHSRDYKSPAQLEPGDVLIVGAGNSGAEIALEVARAGHRTILAGRDVGQIPFRMDAPAAHAVFAPLVLRFVFHRVLTVGTPLGRRARPKLVSQGGPLIRVKSQQLAAAGVERAPRVTGVRDGLPVLADERVIDPANIIWCTGFEPGFSWIDLPVFAENGEPRHERGIVKDMPGLYFVGLHFLYALSSTMIHGVSRDAERIARAVARRTQSAPAKQYAAV